MNENNQLKQEITQLQFQLNQNNISSNNQNNSIDYLIKKLKVTDDKISELEEKINRYPFILDKNETMISIIFSSVDKKINYSLICKNTDTIHRLEEKLYKEYPNLSETDNYYLYKGKKINKFQSFEKNKIKNGDIIILNQNDSKDFLNEKI